MSPLWRFSTFLTLLSLVLSACGTAPTPEPQLPKPTSTATLQPKPTTQPVIPAFKSGLYRNLFAEYLGKSDAEIQAKLDAAFQQLFYGDDTSQRVYYPVGADMAYMLDVANNDVRSEGMSYGMMITVQMNKKEEFDRLWKWTKTYMHQKDGGYRGYFAWHCKTDGTQLAANPAADGELWFATALFFAAARWGNGEGIYHYRAEAQSILDVALHADELSGDLATNLFDAETKQIVFVPQLGNNSQFTDPSYHLPHFLELWARWADKDNQFWAEAVQASRAYLPTSVHPQTGLAPDYSYFDGKPHSDDYHGDFRYDAFRVGANVGVDYLWFAPSEWHVEQSNRMLDFFASEGMDSYVGEYALDGKPLGGGHSGGLVATNAVAALAADPEKGKPFVQALWDMPTPAGKYRYYDGLLTMLGLLQVSGSFRIYDPGSVPASESLATPVPTVTGKFVPPTGRALLLVGPDPKAAASYFDATVSPPGGMSMELSLQKPDFKALDGLAKQFPKSVLAVGLNLGSTLDSIPAGKSDKAIDQVLVVLQALQRPVYLRLGPTFDNLPGKTTPESYVAAWKYFQQRMKSAGVENVALVWHSAAACEKPFGGESLEAWYPGDDVVDWVALSYTACETQTAEGVLAFARRHYKPVMLFADPQKLDAAALQSWKENIFQLTQTGNDVIRALVYYHAGSGLLSTPEIIKSWKTLAHQSFWLRGGPDLFSQLEK